MQEQEQAVGSAARILYAPETEWGQFVQTTAVQTLSITGAPTGGTFTLGFNGEETASITFDTTEVTTATNIENALLALDSIPVGGVSVTSPGADTFTITFGGALAGAWVPAITFEDNSLTGGTAPDGAVVQTTLGAPKWRHVRMIPGSSLQPDYVIYSSQEIRSDAETNADVIGTQRPSGNLRFELSEDWLPFLWHSLRTEDAEFETTSGPVNAVQTLTLTGTPTGGSFRLRFGGENTADIAYNASAADVELAFEALSTVGAGNGTCSGGPLPGTPVTVTFTSGLAATIVAPIKVERNALTGGTDPNIAIDITTYGVPTGFYRHTMIARNTIATGFLLEQGHLDQDVYFAHLGNRVAGWNLAFNIDQVVGGDISLLCREARNASSTSLMTGLTPTPGITDPYTSVQIGLLEGETLRQLATISNATLALSNSPFADRGFVVGDDRRQHLKFGSRIINGTFQAMFQSLELLNKAKTADVSKMKYCCIGGESSIEFYMPRVRYTPANGIWPTIGDDGPIDINLNYKATHDNTEGFALRIIAVTQDPNPRA